MNSVMKRQRHGQTPAVSDIQAFLKILRIPLLSFINLKTFYEYRKRKQSEPCCLCKTTIKVYPSWVRAESHLIVFISSFSCRYNKRSLCLFIIHNIYLITRSIFCNRCKKMYYFGHHIVQFILLCIVFFLQVFSQFLFASLCMYCLVWVGSPPEGKEFDRSAPRAGVSCESSLAALTCFISLYCTVLF